MDPKYSNLAIDLSAELDAVTPEKHESGIFPTAKALALSVDDAESDTTGEEAVTREQRRSRRKRDVRARTISVKRMTKRELELGRLLYPDMEDAQKPKKREDCIGMDRPCPFVSCKHHLYLDVSARTGAIKLNFPDLEVWEMKETCALDISDRGGTTLEEVGAIMNLTRERIRQVEVKGLAKLQALKDMSSLRDYVDEGPVGKRRLPVITKSEDEDEDDIEADELDAAEEASASASIKPPSFDVDAFASDSLDAE
jgi:Sigma-70, region 4